MASPRLSLAPGGRRWIPTEQESVRLTPEGRALWKQAVAADIIAASGAIGVEDVLVEALADMPPSPSFFDRYLFLATGARPFAVVNVAVTEKVDGWREDLIERCEYPLHLLSDPEFTDLDVPWSSDGFIAIRCDEIESKVVGSVTFAASWGDHVVMMRGTSPDMLTILELKVAGAKALAGASLG